MHLREELKKGDLLIKMKKLIYVCVLEIVFDKKKCSEKTKLLVQKKICFFELFYQKIVFPSTLIVARFLNYSVYFVTFYRNKR